MGPGKSFSKEPNVAAFALALFALALFALAAPRASVVPRADGARILAVGVIAGRSHWNFMSAVLGALTDDGHHVTAFTSFADGDRENYTEVDVSDAFPRRLDEDAATMVGRFGDPVATLGPTVRMCREYCDRIHRDDRFRAALRDGRRGGPARFDAIVVEPLWLDCASHAAALLDAPLLYVVPSPMVTFLERPLLGHAPNPATVAHVMARGHGAPRTFVQRLSNAALSAYSAAVLAAGDLWYRHADPQPYDWCPPVPPSVVFVNTHFVTEPPRPVAPNVVHVGGIHLKRPKAIPDDILEFIENSSHGVILLTLGSTIKMTTLPEHIKKTFIEVFRQIPQNVLWKYEGEIKNKPANVMTRKWFPQRDILLHPKIKLFISHGGISGIYEALDAGVPILGFPLFYDQPRNIENLVDSGMAISMELFSINIDTFHENVLELIKNKTYKNNAVIVSKQFKDRPMLPAQSVVYWTNYVLRNKEENYLKSYALNLTWYQYFIIDVIGVMLILFSIILFFSYKISSKLFTYFEYLTKS